MLFRRHVKHSPSPTARSAPAGPPPSDRTRGSRRRGRRGSGLIGTTLLLALALTALPAALRGQQTEEPAGDGGGEAVRAADEVEGSGAVRLSHSENGVRASLEVRPLDGDGELQEGDRLRVRVRLADEASGEPMAVEPPAAWIDFRDPGTVTSDSVCRDRIGDYLRKRMKRRAAVDLNSYYVLTLNRGNNISVLSPFFGMGRTQTVTTIRLPGEGADWALGPDERRLFVTIPLQNLVAVVNTDMWEVRRSIRVGTRPRRIRMGPRGERLWVSLDGGGDQGGIALVDVAMADRAGTVRLGEGPHRVAFRPDGEVAYVASEGAGTVSVVDTRTGEVRATLETGPAPSALDYSEVSDHLYVADRQDGSVTILDGESLEVALRMDGTPGKSELRFDPSGRWGFLLNPEVGEVLVLDAEFDRVRHGFASEGEPYRVAFTDGFAYVRSRGIVEVAMVALSTLGPGGGEAFASDFRSEGGDLDTEGGLQAVSFPAGQTPPGEHGELGPASPFARAPHKHDAVYVAAPGDKAVYFYHYMEGMPTPSGTLKTYTFEPRAVLSMGRRVVEEAPGTFSAVVEAPRAGPLDFALAVDEPRVIHCFPFRVAAAATASRGPSDIQLAVEAVDGTRLPARTDAELRFRLVDRATDRARAGLEVRVLVTSPAGHRRTYAAEAREDGSYEVNLRLPGSGVYYLSPAVDEMGKGFRDIHPLILRAGDLSTSAPTPGGP